MPTFLGNIIYLFNILDLGICWGSAANTVANSKQIPNQHSNKFPTRSQRNSQPIPKPIPSLIPNSFSSRVPVRRLDDEPGFDHLAKHVIDLLGPVTSANVLL